MTDKILEKLSQAFEIPTDYMMYPGGAGGENLIIQVTQFSPKYHFIPYKVNLITNKCSIQYEQVVRYLLLDTESGVTDTSTLTMFEKIKEVMLCDFNESEIYSMLDRYIEAAKSTKKRLYKRHISTTDYFNSNNTYLIDVSQDEIWLRYSIYLKIYKVFPFVYQLDDYFKSYINQRIVDVPLRQEILKYAAIVENFCEGHIAATKYMTAKEAFKLSINEVLESLAQWELSTLPKVHTRTSQHLSHLSRRIYLDKFFVPGYLEDIFEISNAQFRTNMLEWHWKNLNMLNSFGIDTTEWEF